MLGGALNMNMIFQDLEINDLEGTYRQFSSKVDEKLFFKPHGIHGVLHTKRVLMLNLILAYKMKLNREEIMLLATASIYHDIGRKTDGVCAIHGFYSFKKATKLGLINDFSENDLKTLKYIMVNHCIDDQSALQTITKEDKAIFLLKVFKDADNLDRVRLGDLNTDFLRHDISKKLVAKAQYLYQLGEKLNQIFE